MAEEIKPNLSFHLANLSEDKDKILSFWKENFPLWDERKYNMFYTGSPYGPAKVWLLKDSQIDIPVGITCYFPRAMFLSGIENKSGITGDLAIEKKYRRYGVGTEIQLKLNQSSVDEKCDFLYGTPNSNSEGVAIKSGYDVIGRTTRSVKVLRYNPYLKRIFKFQLLTDLLSLPLNFIKKMFSKESSHKNVDYKYELLDSFDERFDKLWDEAKSEFPIIGIRSAKWLNWRFPECPYKKFHIFAVSKKSDNSVIGYFVYQISEGNILIADFFGRHLTKNSDLLISFFVNYQRTQPIDMITFYFFGNKKIIEKFKEYGFIIRSDNRSIIIYLKDNPPLKEILVNENNWHYLDGDNDAEP